MTTDLPSKKRIGFVELPDEALDLFGHYAKRPNWEVALVVTTMPRSYAARMGGILQIPVLERPEADTLRSCDRIVVGNTAGLAAMVNDLVDADQTEVLSIGEALQELNRTPFPGTGAQPQASSGASGAFGASAASSAAASSASSGDSANSPSAAMAWKEYTSDSSFDAGTLLGSDLREKLGALTIDTDGDRLLHEILEMAIRVTHADSGSIMLVDEYGTLRVAVADGLPQWVIAHARQEVGKGISGQVFATGKPRLLHGHLPSSQSGSADVRPGLREAACVPIPTMNGPIGVLNISVESEERKLDESSLAMMNLFAREASVTILKALNLNRLSGSTQKEAVLRQVERLMTLQEPMASRLRTVGEALGQALGAHYAHCFVTDETGSHLELQTGASGWTVVQSQPQPLDRGFVGWILEHNTPDVHEVSNGDSEVAMAYVPVVSSRPEGVLVLERIPLDSLTAVQILNLVTEVKETVEAQIALEEAAGDWDDDNPESHLASA